MSQVEIDWNENAGNYAQSEELIKNEVLKRVSKLKELPHLLSVLNAEFEGEVEVSIMLSTKASFFDLRCFLEGEGELRMMLHGDDIFIGYVRIKGVKSKDFEELKRESRKNRALILERLGIGGEPTRL